MQLDRNQQNAVKHFTGPAIVIAGPGSGKTTVVTTRILNLIRTHNISPSRILAIAFNRKAVEEMAERLFHSNTSTESVDMSKPANRPEIRTLHAFGKDIIIENYRLAGFREPPEVWTGKIDQIISKEQKQIKQKIGAVAVSIYKIESQKTGKCYIGQTTNPERRKREHFCHSSNDRLRQAIRYEVASHFSFEVIERVRGRKANAREAHWIDFYRERAGVFNRADPLRSQHSNLVLLEMFCQHFDIRYKEHLDRDPDFKNLREISNLNRIKETIMRAKRQVVAGVFHPEMVEGRVARVFATKYEFYKTKANAIDFEDMIIYAADLLETYPHLREHYRQKYPYVLVDEFQDIAPADFRLISLLSENLFAVGDDDQAIYGFRGGDSGIMQKFASRREVTKYEITRNYRSTSTIVEHARALIERNAPRIRKNLRAHNPSRQDIRTIETTCKTVESALLQELMPLQETAVLVRTNYEKEQIQKMLAKHVTFLMRVYFYTGSLIQKMRAKHVNAIEVATIHTSKGREWEKVILVHNTLNRHFPRRDSQLTEERRVFYVAMTRAKSELVVLGGECPFVRQFQEIPKTVSYYLRQLMYWWARKK